MNFLKNNVSSLITSLLAALLCFAGDGNAADAPLIFTHDKIIIDRHAAPAPPAEVKQDTKPNSDIKTAVLPPLIVDVVMREAGSFYKQDGWFNMDSLQNEKGILLVFDKPVSAPIIGTNQYAPLDIFMINEQGKIIQVVPSLVLATLEEHIYPDAPIKAFLLLAGGSHERFSIQPGDEVQHSLFKKPPPVLDSATPAPKPLLEPLTATPEQPIDPMTLIAPNAVTQIQPEQPAQPAQPEQPKPNDLSVKRKPSGQLSPQQPQAQPVTNPQKTVILP